MRIRMPLIYILFLSILIVSVTESKTHDLSAPTGSGGGVHRTVSSLIGFFRIATTAILILKLIRYKSKYEYYNNDKK